MEDARHEEGSGDYKPSERELVENLADELYDMVDRLLEDVTAVGPLEISVTRRNVSLSSQRLTIVGTILGTMDLREDLVADAFRYLRGTKS